MMKMLAMGAALLSAAGCTTTDDPPPPPMNTGDAQCDAEAAKGLIGQSATADLGAEALRRTGARAIRWIQPGQAVTMDYRPDRLNIKLDAQNRVEDVTCG